jgi:hypothetical protein
VPTAVELLWCLTSIAAAKTDPIERGAYVRTASLDAERLRVIVGMSDDYSLLIYHYWDQLAFEELGIQPIRKF